VSPPRRIELRADGVATPGIEAGPAQDVEGVLFVHGNPGSASDWNALVEETGAFARAVAIDMPGFGHAPLPSGFEPQISSYAAFLERARKQLGLERVHLVVHDFGGPFGLHWGLEHDAAWRSVVLINVGVLPGYRWHALARRWRTPVLGELMNAWIPRWAWRRSMTAAGPKELPRAFVDKMYDEFDRTTRATVLRLYRATPDPGATADAVGGPLARLHKPALVVWGAKDPYITVDYAERQREFFDVRGPLVLPESGHWPFQDDPQAVAAAMLPFLRERLAE
jgi:pimeloyl-ACP methyl ester carboxylesterase